MAMDNETHLLCSNNTVPTCQPAIDQPKQIPMFGRLCHFWLSGCRTHLITYFLKSVQPLSAALTELSHP